MSSLHAVAGATAQSLRAPLLDGQNTSATRQQRHFVVGRRAAVQAAAAAVHTAPSGINNSDSKLLHQQSTTLTEIGRRSTLLASLQAAAALVLLPAAASAQDGVVTVGAGQAYATISEALQHTPSGGTVEVYGGRYTERLVITQPVTIRAAPGEAVEVAWTTGEPYQATLECGPGVEGGVLLQGLRVKHSSPSVANNYAVRLQGSNAVLLDCDISSATGDGVGIEGGAPRLQNCSMHHCERHGVAVFGDLFGGGCSAVLEGCSLQDNKLDGLLVRDGATPSVAGCAVSGNGGWGMLLKDAGGSYSGNTVTANSKGSVGYALLYPEVDTARMVVENKLDRPVHFLGRGA